MQGHPKPYPEVEKFWADRFQEGWTEQNRPIPKIKVREPYYEQDCKCGFVGSSEVYLEQNYGDDGGMLCPRCLVEH